MPTLTYSQQVTYRAVRAIESSSIPGLQANTKLLVAFLAGAAEKQFQQFFVAQKDLYGALPKANALSVISCCGALADMGFITKTSRNGNIYYSTTDLSPFEDDDLLFSDKLSPRKKTLLDSIREFIRNYCPTLKESEQKNYFGFRCSGKNQEEWSTNWFWITRADSPVNLSFRYRDVPLKVVEYSSYSFNEKNVETVIEIIKKVLSRQKTRYSLNCQPGVEYKNPFGALLNASRDKTDRCRVNSSSQAFSQTEIIDFSRYAGENAPKIYVNNGANQMNALLSLGEASPFFYFERTVYYGDTVKRLTEGKRNFDFSMRRWKLVAWSTTSENRSLISSALILNKKSKSLWMVLSVRDRKVLCVSQRPFKVSDGQSTFLPADLIKLLFE